MKSILITGISTGIGKACAKLLCSAQYKVFGTVRNEDDRIKAQQDCGENIHPIIMDVTNEASIMEAKSIVESNLKEKKLDVLINNAGIGLGGPIKYIDTDIFRKQFEVNLFGVVSVTRIFLELLGANEENSHAGKIIMISSVSGKRAYPFTSPYTASKHALEGYSDSIRKELMLYGIDVILVQPGPVKTAIWDKAPDVDDNPFLNTEYESILRRFYKAIIIKGKQGLHSDVIAKKVKHIIETNRPRTRYVLTGNKFRDYILPGLLPDRLFDKLIAKVLKIKKLDIKE